MRLFLQKIEPILIIQNDDPLVADQGPTLKYYNRKCVFKLFCVGNWTNLAL